MMVARVVLFQKCFDRGLKFLHRKFFGWIETGRLNYHDKKLLSTPVTRNSFTIQIYVKEQEREGLTEIKIFIFVVVLLLSINMALGW